MMKMRRKMKRNIVNQALCLVVINIIIVQYASGLQQAAVDKEKHGMFSMHNHYYLLLYFVGITRL